jgi:hypothetical protein
MPVAHTYGQGREGGEPNPPGLPAPRAAAIRRQRTSSRPRVERGEGIAVSGVVRARLLLGMGMAKAR